MSEAHGHGPSAAGPPVVAPKAGDATPGSGGSVKAAAAGAVRWSMVGLTGRQVIKVGFTLILARVLGPQNFGIVAQAAVVIAFMGAFLDQGLGSALVQRPVLSDRDVGTVVWMNAATALVLGGLTAASAPLIADFFKTAELTDVMRVLALDVAVLAMAVTPQAILIRSLRFRSVAVAEVASATAGGAAGIIALALGAGYWAFIVQTLATDLFMLLGFLAAAGRLPLKGSVTQLRELWGFGVRVMGFQVLNYFNRNVDNALIGRFLGATQLGLYALSYRIMMVPIQNLGGVASRVAFPMYSQVQDDRQRIGRQFLAGAKLIALVSFPLMGLVFVGAPLGIPLVFGEAWTGAVVPMQILAVTGMAQSVGTTTGGVLMACGRADWLLRWGIGSTIVIVGSIALGLQWGIIGVSATYTLATFALTPILIHIIGRLVGFRVSDLIRVLAPAFTATVALVTTGGAVELGLHAARTDSVVALALGLSLASVTYLAVLRLRWPDSLAEIREFIRLFLRRA